MKAVRGTTGCCRLGSEGMSTGVDLLVVVSVYRSATVMAVGVAARLQDV